MPRYRPIWEQTKGTRIVRVILADAGEEITNIFVELEEYPDDVFLFLMNTQERIAPFLAYGLEGRIQGKTVSEANKILEEISLHHGAVEELRRIQAQARLGPLEEDAKERLINLEVYLGKVGSA